MSVSPEQPELEFFHYSVNISCILGIKGEIRKVNPVFQKLLGYEPQACIQKDFIDFVCPDDRSKTLIALNEIRQGSTKLDLQIRFYCDDGSYRNLQWGGCANLKQGFIYLSAHERLKIRQEFEDHQASDDIYSSILTEVPVGIFRSDQKGNCIFVNSSCTSITGLSNSDALGQGWTKSLHPDDRDRVFTEWKDAIQNASSFCSEYRFIRPDGQMIWILGKAVPYKDHQGILIGYIGALVDITAQKTSEAALQESNERWQLALNGNNDGIWDWNIKTNEVFFSTRWKEMLGYTEDEIDNQLEEWSKRVHPDDLADVMKVIQEHLAQNIPYYVTEHRMQCKDGSYKWILDRGQALWDETGKPIRMVGSHTDITERKNLELEQQKLLTILENAPDFISISDYNGETLWLNHRAKEVLGCSESCESFQGNLTNYYPPWAAKIVQEQGIPMALEQSVWVGETALRTMAGQEIPVSQVIIAHQDGNGQVEYLSTIMRDISKLKYTEFNLKKQLSLAAYRAEITTLLSQENSLQDLFRQCVRAMVTHLNAAVAQLWLFNPRSNMLELEASMDLDARSTDIHYQISLEQCTIGLIARDRKPYFTNEVNLTSQIYEEDWLEQYNIAAFAGYPLIVESHAAGVICMFSNQNIDSWTINALEVAANEISMGIERDRVKEKASQQEELYRRIFESVSDGIIIANPVNGNILTSNQSTLHLLGYSAAAFHECSVISFCCQDFDACSGISSKTALSHYLSKQSKIRCRDGSILDVEIFCSPIQVGDQNCLLIVITDISKRKKIETAMQQMNEELEARVQQRTQELITAKAILQTSEEQFRQLAEHLNQVFWMIDVKQKSILYVSPAFERVWGESCESLYNNSSAWYDTIHPDDRDYVQSRRSMQFYGTHNNVEYRIIRPDGEIRWINDRSFPILNSEGEIYRLAGIAEDITVRKAATEGLQKLNEDLEKRVKERTIALQMAKDRAVASSQAKSIFLATMSHELRTPLNAILGFSQLLNQSPNLDTQQYENIQAINRSGTHLRTLINDVLDMSKLEAGRSTFIPKDIDLKQMLQDLQDMFGHGAQDKGIILKIWKMPDVSSYIQTDEIKLRQVLINLLSNALKFTTEGSVQLRVWNASEVLNPRSSHPKMKLSFAVKDTGMGIAPEDYENIFNAFSQTRNGENFQGGTGLGLAISKGFVELMGGQLTVNSQINQGSCFKFTIPVKVLMTDISSANKSTPSSRPFSFKSSNGNASITSPGRTEAWVNIGEFSKDPILQPTQISNLDSLQTLPTVILHQLHQAAIECDSDEILKIISQFRPDNAELADNLLYFVTQYQFEPIISALSL